MTGSLDHMNLPVPGLRRAAGRRLVAPLAALATALLLVGAMGGPVYANHSATNTSVVIYRGTSIIFSEDQWVDCDEYGSCEVVFLNVGKRAYDRFFRMCGDWELILVIPANTHGMSQDCQGSGPWSVSINASLNSVNNVPQFHPEPVYIHLYFVETCWGCK